MYLESLVRLAEIIDHYKNENDILISEEFHNDTTKLIEDQTKFLIADLEFKNNNPGPYSFGFGDLEITIYSPEQTGIQEWAALARKGNWQKAYRFNSIIGLVKMLVLVIEDVQKDESSSEQK